MKQMEIVYNGIKIAIMTYDKERIYLFDEDNQVIISDPMPRDDHKIHELLKKYYYKKPYEQLKLF
jgi:hypothetical protein